jgi:hypothetical protein
MNRFIVPVCLLYLASLCGSAAGAEALQSADNSSTNSVIVESAPTMQSSRPIRDKCRKAARTTLAVVTAPVVVPVALGAVWWVYGMPQCAAKVRSAFTWDRTPAAE